MTINFVVTSIMYGFGDEQQPAADTINVMEELLIEHITDVVRLQSRTLLVHQLTRFPSILAAVSSSSSYFYQPEQDQSGGF